VNSYTDPGVAFNLDGVYIGRPTATSGYFYDISRLEVLKGPQGTLYGRNATGGAINVIPTPPVLGENSGHVSAAYGNYDSVQVEGAVNYALSDIAALRVAGNYATHDGYMSDGSSDLDARALRAQLLLEPSDTFKIRVSADYFERFGRGIGGTVSATSTRDAVANTTTITPSGLPLSTGNLDPRVGALLSSVYNPLPGRALEPYTVPGDLDGQFWGVHTQVDIGTPLGTLTLLPSYRSYQATDIQNNGGLQVFDQQDGDQTSFEARLAGTAGAVDYIVGGYYYDEKYDARYQPYAQAFTGNQNFESTTSSQAAFLRLTYHLADQLRLVGGVRYTYDDKSFDGSADTLLTVCTAPTGCPGAPLLPFPYTAAELVNLMGLVSVTPNNSVYVLPTNPAAANTIFARTIKQVSGDLSNGQFTYRGAIEYDLNDSSLLYASYESGFRSGGFAFALAKNSFQPESIDAYTIGMKNRLLENRLQLNLEAFYWKYQDQQISHLTNDIDGGPVFITENAGSSTIQGAELEIQYLLTQDTLIGADVQYLDATYDDFKFEVPGTVNPVASATQGATVYFPQVSGCPVSAPSSTGRYTVDCAGKTSPYSPEWTVTGRVQQTVAIGANDLVLSASSRYQSDSYVGFDLLPTDLRKAYWISNADITFATPDERFTATLFVNNIEDKRVALTTQYQSLPQINLLIPSDPRTYGLRLGTRF
jgi:iron complex outermembrane receptor protein